MKIKEGKVVCAIGSNRVEMVPLVVVVGLLVLVEEQSAGTQVSSSSL